MFNRAVMRVRDFASYGSTNQVAGSLQGDALPSIKSENRSDRKTANEDDYTQAKPPPATLPAHIVWQQHQTWSHKCSAGNVNLPSG